MKRIYLDTEYCYPGMMRGTPRPTSADMRQIVQIAAIVFDTDTGKELSYFDQLVFPTYEKQLPEFFVELTGITQQNIDASAISFEQAFAAFVAFCGDLSVWTFDKDEEVLRQNCGYIGVDWPLKAQFTRVKSLLPKWDIDPEAYSSGTLYKAAGLELSGHIHNALHDIRSMANAIHVFEQRAN